MSDKNRIINLQTQLRIAKKALIQIRDQDSHSPWSTAEQALEDIQQIQNLKLGMKPEGVI